MPNETRTPPVCVQVCVECNFFALEGGQKEPDFYIYYEKLLFRKFFSGGGDFTCGSELMESLHEFLFFNPNTRLIVIDTLQRIRENSSSSYSYAADYDEIKPFKEFTDIHNVALLLVHHTRKNTESTNALDQISGTNGLLGAADGGFILHRKDGQVLLEQTGRDLPSQRYVLRFDTAACLWNLLRCENEPFQEKPDPLLDIVDRQRNF